jgi:hypothetical protein
MVHDSLSIFISCGTKYVTICISQLCSPFLNFDHIVLEKSVYYFTFKARNVKVRLSQVVYGIVTCLELKKTSKFSAYIIQEMIPEIHQSFLLFHSNKGKKLFR